MAILKVTLHEETWDDEITVILSEWISVGTGHKIFRVESDEPITCEQAYGASAGGVQVSGPGNIYSEDRTFAFLSSRKGRHINGSPRHVEIDCEFKDPSGGGTLEEFIGQPARISSTGVTDTEEYWQDFSDPPQVVCNAAGEPFDNLPRRLANGSVIKIEKNVSAETKAAIQAARHSNNPTSMTIDGFTYDVDTLLLWNASFEPLSDGANIYKATIEIVENPNIWIDEIANVGFSQLITDDDSGLTIRVDIAQQDKDGNWQPVTCPWPLDSDGVAKDDPTDIDMLQFYPYPQRSWAGVPLA